MHNTALKTLSLACLVATALAAGQDDVFTIQPEIHHQFRAAETMPATWFSQLFALVTLSPWLLLVVGWSLIGITPNSVVSGLSNRERGGAHWIVAFVVALGVTDYMFYLYWTRWNIFETLKYTAVWGLVLFAVGQRALSVLYDHRVAAEAKK
ncbi:Oligosaccharyltransferase subunit Ribophorin II-domain-containing protein [Gongronella butleri]|nr:Oligosaccharyltransferase subunit Ribophorin II-domain-containing protein [Gongronella butleri]